ncbi:hypothetical protein SH528x_003165 [Novipirellula sp. SH528]|uniref:hypothetical protein n=1 Tax=Novipirellula sp. SH528 TaxID=3454466 RepID=UPI003FA113C7
MPPNSYEPPPTPPDDPGNPTPIEDDRDSLEAPTLAYTANGNIEAHSVVTWLQSNGVRAYAVEDNSGVSLFAFGTISQSHKPQVFVDKSDLESAGELLRQFEEQRDRRRTELDDKPPIQSECEDCGETSEFPASQDGTTQNCPKCYAFMDVGNIDWPDDFDVDDHVETPSPELSEEAALDNAARLDEIGDWQDAIVAYRNIIDRWPEHATYASNCISAIQYKIDAADGERQNDDSAHGSRTPCESKTNRLHPADRVDTRLKSNPQIAMKPATQNGLLTAAIVAGLLSLPSTWMTIRNTNIRITPNFGGQLITPDTEFANLVIPSVTNTSFDVTGLNGHVTFLAKFPIWLIVGIAITGCLFQIAEKFDAIAFPRILLWSIAISALALTVLPLVIALGSGRSSPGIGWFLGLACAVTPVVVLWSTRTSTLSER